jgi:tRNA U34 5-carboxymethylaminomethyl modifying GTPase MnmE/TrmE
MEIDIKKVMGDTPKDQYEAVRKMNKAQQEVIEALHIMQSAIDFPEIEMIEINQKRMKDYLSKFCKD